MGRTIFHRYSISDLNATSTRAGRETVSENDNAPIVFCAERLTIEMIRLPAINGTFSMSNDLRSLNDETLPRGYQSSSRRTAGTLTAMVLLDKARIKKTSDRKYCPFRHEPGVAA